jgi:hypothetical protein
MNGVITIQTSPETMSNWNGNQHINKTKLNGQLDDLIT